MPLDHAWFVAYAPANHPRISVVVIVEHGEHGSSAAAPIAREMIKTYLSEEIFRQDGTVISSVGKSKKKAIQDGF